LPRARVRRRDLLDAELDRREPTPPPLLEPFDRREDGVVELLAARPPRREGRREQGTAQAAAAAVPPARTPTRRHCRHEVVAHPSMLGPNRGPRGGQPTPSAHARAPAVRDSAAGCPCRRCDTPVTAWPRPVCPHGDVRSGA